VGGIQLASQDSENQTLIIRLSFQTSTDTYGEYQAIKIYNVPLRSLKPFRVLHCCKGWLTATTLALPLVLVVSLSSAYGQANEPITKENLLRSLKEGRPRISWTKWLEIVKRLGVDFQMTLKDAEEIRAAGAYYGGKGLDELVAAVGAAAAPRGRRLRISVFSSDPPCADYRSFQENLANSLRYLPSIDRTSKDIAALRLVNEGQALPIDMSLEQIDRYWEITNSLQILSGVCLREGQSASVFSQVFLGKLGEPLPNPVPMEFKNDPHEYRKIRDLHYMLIYYSLAKAAEAKGYDAHLIIPYLNSAYGYASQCQYNSSEVVGPIRSVIKDFLKKLQAPSPPDRSCPK
jgi:hypothetical protein